MKMQLERIWRNFTRGIDNLIRWGPVIWDDVDWDWDHLTKIMEYKLGRMAIMIGDNGHHIGCERTAKQMRTCQALLKRIRADDYMENAQRSHSKSSLVLHSMAMEKQDMEYFGKLFGKYLKHWWD